MNFHTLFLSVFMLIGINSAYAVSDFLNNLFLAIRHEQEDEVRRLLDATTIPGEINTPLDPKGNTLLHI